MKLGDLVIFYGNGEVYAFGTVASKVSWPSNNDIWPDGTNWDHIYSLNNFTEIAAGDRLDYTSLRTLTEKLDVQSVGCRDLDALGLTKDEVLDFVLHTGPRKIRPAQRTSEFIPERGVADPPQIGERFRNRDVIHHLFGGDAMKGIVKFPNEDFVNTFSHDEGPYADEVDLETGVIAYRGQGLTGDQVMKSGNALLQAAWVNRTPIRYWVGPQGGPFEFEKWVLITDLDTVIEPDKNLSLAKRFVWFLNPIAGPERESFSNLKVETPVVEDVAAISIISNTSTNLLDQYAAATARLGDSTASVERVDEAPKKRFRRKKAARDLVIARSEGLCENPGCTGMPPDIDQRGNALLDVDHLTGLSEGGADHPENMIALCPNCHRAKTLGVNRSLLTKSLRKIAKKKHQTLLARPGQDSQKTT